MLAVYRQKGFSLLEIMIALVFITLAFIAVYQFLTSSIFINHRARLVSQAYHAAYHELEQVRQVPFDSLVNQTNGPLIGSVPQLSSLPNGQGSLTIENYEGNSNIKKVTVTISWRAPGGDTETINLVTLVTRGGIVK